MLGTHTDVTNSRNRTTSETLVSESIPQQEDPQATGSTTVSRWRERGVWNCFGPGFGVNMYIHSLPFKAVLQSLGNLASRVSLLLQETLRNPIRGGGGEVRSG